MTTSYGPVSGNSRIRFEFGQSQDNWTVTIYAAAYLDMLNNWSSNGTWPASWSGQWGSGSNNVYRNIPANGSSLVAGDANYYVARADNDYWVQFTATAQNYTGNPSHTINVLIPAKPKTPAAPTMLSLDQITNSSMRAMFSGNSDGGSPIIRWELQYQHSTADISTGPIVNSNGVSNIYGLGPNTLYNFRARGVNAMGNGAWSSVMSAWTQDVPGPVTNSLNNDTLTHNSAQIYFSDVNNHGSTNTDYELQLSLNSSFSSIFKSSTGLGSPPASYTWTGLSRLTTYYHRIRVKNGWGWGPYTSISFTTTGQAPTAPSDYTASDVASTTAYFTLPTVADNGGLPLDGWQYMLNTAATDTGATTSAVSTEYIAPFLQLLTPGTKYYFKMAVRNSIGFSPYGPWVSFTMRTDVPTPPTSFIVDNVTETTATASWQPPVDLLGSALWGYSVRFAQNKAFSRGLIEYTRAESELSQALTGLLPGTTYYVQVNAISANGPGSRSPIVSFKTLGTAPGVQALWMRINGTWRGGTMWLKVSGVWKKVTVWQNVNGTWRKN